MIELRTYLLIKWLSIKNGHTLDKLFLLTSLILISFSNLNPLIVFFISIISNIVFYGKKNDYSCLIHFFKKEKVLTVLFFEFLLLNGILLFALLHSEIQLFFIGLYSILAMIIFISSIKLKNYSGILFEFNIIPLKYFELKCYLRSKSYFLLFFIFSFILIFQDYFFFFLYSMFIMEFLSQIFSINENKDIINGYFQNTDITNKVLSNIIFISLFFYSIGFILALFLYEEYLISSLYLFSITFLFMALTISNKYQNYTGRLQKNDLGIANSVLYFILSLSIVGAVYKILENIKNSSKNISKYVGD